MWTLLAKFLALPVVADWLINRAKRTPYSHVTSADGSDVYMERYWLFNPYPAPGDYRRKGWRDWLPSIRVHYIRRPDQDRHLHDHPWAARTIILRGYYIEERLSGPLHARIPGDTARIDRGQYHRIRFVPDDGAYTLFLTWRYRGDWGFLVDGRKVPHRQYLGDR